MTIIGGWDPSSPSAEISKDIKAEIDQAFANVEHCLKHAGGKGWAQVFRVNSYHTDITPESTAHMTECLRRWLPNHKPIWTMVGVARLAFDAMHVEIEVSAFDPDGAKQKS